MTYLTIRDSAVEQIKKGMLPLFPKMRVEALPGVFTEQSIRQQAQRTPAVLTSLVRVADGMGRNRYTFVSWVLYRATSEDKLYDGALKIVSALTGVIGNADYDEYIRETVTESECLFSGTLDAMNVTLWAVKWELVLATRPLAKTGELDGLENFDEDTAIIDSVRPNTTMEE